MFPWVEHNINHPEAFMNFHQILLVISHACVPDMISVSGALDCAGALGRNLDRVILRAPIVKPSLDNMVSPVQHQTRSSMPKLDTRPNAFPSCPCNNDPLNTGRSLYHLISNLPQPIISPFPDNLPASDPINQTYTPYCLPPLYQWHWYPHILLWTPFTIRKGLKRIWFWSTPAPPPTCQSLVPAHHIHTYLSQI